jgi:hypothetical protein
MHGTGDQGDIGPDVGGIGGDEGGIGGLLLVHRPPAAAR